MRINLAVLHLLAASSFSRRTRELEVAHKGEIFGAFWEDILAQATAAVMISVAGLEAYANELFIDHEKVFPGLPIEVMAKLWELYEQKAILEKFEMALLIKKAEPFDRGSKVYQDVAALIKLRNCLVHFKPKWFHEQEEHAKLSKLLGGKIEQSPFLSPEPFFPRAWAGSSCTEWAVRSVVELIKQLERRTGIERIAQFVPKICP
jgi:hypothetical protein